LIASLALILFACELFTNGIEWAGHKLNLSQGATGSVLAAAGTALPETSIPVLALIAGGSGGNDVAVGAIAGAPFMLSTIAFFVTGAAVYIYSLRGRRERTLNIDAKVKERDLGFFLAVYSVAVLATFVPRGLPRYIIAACLSASYVLYLYLSLRHQGEKGGEIEDLHLSSIFKLKHRKRYIFIQVVLSLALIVLGAHYFVVAVQRISEVAGVPALLLSLIITPVATELPEKMNSVLWIRDGKDTLALGNITGAMVFQSSFPVAIGVAFTPWDLRGPTMVSAVIAVISAVVVYLTLKIKKDIPPWILLLGGLFYLAFILYLIF